MLHVVPSPALVAQPAPALPVDRLVVGKAVDEVVDLLPRLFNLCRAAQGTAVKAALGRPYDASGIKTEIIRDHLLKFHVTWPAFFGHPPSPLPDNWAVCGKELRLRAFGPRGAVPATAAEFFAFLEGEDGYAPVLRLIDGCFLAAEAASDLDPVSPNTIWSPGLSDNSVAARVRKHPAMVGISDVRGQGPLWRAAARLYDLANLIEGDVPAVVLPSAGEAIVPAARGLYAVRIESNGDHVTRFERITPTDHLLSTGGVLDQCLATLPAAKSGMGRLLLDVLDPCSPVRLKEVAHA